jgi:transposase InsO family protein
MRLNDKTLARNYLKHMKQLVQEYELIKAKKHSRYIFVTEFYKANNITRQNFIKYYNRFKLSSMDSSLVPAKRGRKFGTLKSIPFIQNKIVELREKGFGRYEIHDFLLPKYGKYTPSATTIYNILVKKGLNKLDPRVIQINKRRIIKEKAGEMGHMDCHRLAKGILEGKSDEYFLLTLTDDFTRLVFSIVIPNLQALTVMLSTQKLLAVFNRCYGIDFESILTDNGSEFGRKDIKEKTKENHPFERLLLEYNIKHKYTKPYRPQTNGKVERFWRSLEEELLKEQVYQDKSQLEEELFEYCCYYNHIRRHQGIDNMTPYQKLNSVTE